MGILDHRGSLALDTWDWGPRLGMKDHYISLTSLGLQSEGKLQWASISTGFVSRTVSFRHWQQYPFFEVSGFRGFSVIDSGPKLCLSCPSCEPIKFGLLVSQGLANSSRKTPTLWFISPCGFAVFWVSSCWGIPWLSSLAQTDIKWFFKMLFNCIRYTVLVGFSLNFLSFIVTGNRIQNFSFAVRVLPLSVILNLSFFFYFEFKNVKEVTMVDFYHILYLNLKVSLSELS